MRSGSCPPCGLGFEPVCGLPADDLALPEGGGRVALPGARSISAAAGGRGRYTTERFLVHMLLGALGRLAENPLPGVDIGIMSR